MNEQFGNEEQQFFFNNDCEDVLLNMLFGKKNITVLKVRWNSPHSPVITRNNKEVTIDEMLKRIRKNSDHFFIIILLNRFHFCAVYYNDDDGTFEFIDTQPPRLVTNWTGISQEDIYKTFLEYEKLYHFFTGLSYYNGIKNGYNGDGRFITAEQSYNNEQPIQSVQNYICRREGIEDNEWDGGNCIFLTTIIIYEMIMSSLTFQQWIQRFYDQINFDNRDMIDILIDKQRHYTEICKERLNV